MKSIQATARFQIHEGNLDEFKKVANECIAVTKEKDPGTLQYDWFLNPDQSEFVVRESYSNSDAVLAHLGNLGELFDKILQLADFSIEVYGDPSEELQKAAAALKPGVYSFYKGI